MSARATETQLCDIGRMALVQLSKRQSTPKQWALFDIGFRPFFFAAVLMGIISVALWIFVYPATLPVPVASLSPFQWHAHEMVYGYTMAVIAGFLLTAIMNWTGIQTLRGKLLAALVGTWVLARICFLGVPQALLVAGLSDIAFSVFLLAAVAAPIVRAKQWRQMGILSKVLLLGFGNLCFYLGALGYLQQGMYWGLYGGLYIIVGLILTIGSRVMPAFVSNGVDEDVSISCPRWLNVSSLFLFLGFFVNELFIQSMPVLGVISLALFFVNTVRLYFWHTPGIWRKPLLWSLYLAFVFIDVGFLLFALRAFAGISPYIAIHAFAFGGIGLATMSMMARVTLGHTGRNIRRPPAGISYFLGLLVVGALVRVGMPLLLPIWYTHWILFSQLCWVLAFTAFLFIFGSMYFRQSADA